MSEVAENLFATSQTTTDAFADVGSAWNKTLYKTTTITVKNTHGSNSITYKILGSIDGGDNFDIEIVAATAVAAGIVSTTKFSDYYNVVKIQAKATVAASQGTVTARAAAIAV